MLVTFVGNVHGRVIHTSILTLMIIYVKYSKHPAIYRRVNIRLLVPLLFLFFILFDGLCNLAVITDVFPE